MKRIPLLHIFYNFIETETEVKSRPTHKKNHYNKKKSLGEFGLLFHW